ncbi:MAG: ECF-type sigma factor [Pirellulaceae bacterium]|nr:ECF-type sigma factor [Pirellulaceae bacterium]
MTTPSKIDMLADKRRVGDDSALELLFQQFAERLINLARRKIATYYRNKVDAEDVVQSVFKSFLRRYRDERLDIRSGDSLWGLLTIITVRKCADRVEQLRASCRDVRREIMFSSNLAHDSGAYQLIVDREPNPYEVVVLAETVEQLFLGFESDDRAIIEFQLQGISTAETAVQLRRAERTVRRIRERVRNRLLRQIENQSDIDSSDVAATQNEKK